MTSLPAYSGPAKCPKCRSYVSTEWHWGGGIFAPKKGGDGAESSYPCHSISDLSEIGEGEHLCRVCQNCGYGWVEACADSEGETT